MTRNSSKSEDASDRKEHDASDRKEHDVVKRRDTHLTETQAPVGVGIDAQVPDSMPRAEDDAATRAHSPEFHDRPGSGRDTAKRHFYF